MKSVINYMKALWHSMWCSQSSDVGYRRRVVADLLPSFFRVKMVFALTAMVFTLGVGQVWGAEGDLVTSVTPTTDLASGTTYQAETGTDWAVNVTNNSAFGTNAKSGNDSKLMLSNNEDTESRNTAIASALASYTGGTFTDETQYVAALIGLSSISNVGKVTVTYTGTNGGNPGDMWVLYTTNSGTSYTVAGHTSSVSSGTYITFSTIASAQYAVVFKRTAAFGLKGATISFYEGASAGFTVTIARNNSSYGTVSAASVTGVTSGTSISATNNVLSVGAANVTATPNSGYKFSSWSGIPGGGTVTGNITVTANFAAVSYSNYRTSCTPPSDPSITVSPASITNLDYIVGQGPSAAQNITLGGSNLTASITITAPTNFEVSTDGGSTYGDSRTVTQTGGVPDVSTVKVRLKAGLVVNTYGSANVTFASTGATTQNVAVTGHVLKPTITATPNPVSWSTSVGVAPSTTSVTVTGSNLKDDIDIALGGTNSSDFSISTASITQTSGSASESVTITYTGAYNAVATKTATLTLTSDDASTVVVNITFNVINDPNLYFLTALSDIHPHDKVIIVGSMYVALGDEYEEDYALANATTTSTYPPDAVDVKAMISSNKQTLSYSGTALQWNINYNSVSGEFTINRDGDDDVFLYCIDNNKGLSVATTGSYNVFNITSDYIKCKDLTRYLGVYNSDDWRTYTSNGGNIADQEFSFYVKPSTDPYVTLGASFSEFTYEYNNGPSTPQSFTVSGANLAANLVVTAPTNYEVCKTSDGSYTSSVSFTPSTGTVSEQTVYIRLVAGLSVGDYDYAQASGLSVTSGVADAAKAALEGSVTPETFTVTATSNNGSYGSVSPASQNTSTTATITATPESGYRVISGAGGYTVTSGTATVVNNGNNTFTVTPTTDCTVQINFEAIVMRTVSWNVNGNPYSTYTGAGTLSTSAEEGAKWSTLTLPDNPADNTLYAGCERTKFVGWSASPLYGDGNSAPSDLFKTTADDNADSHTISGNTTFYAVFAKGSGDGWQKVTSTPADWCGDYLLVYEASSSSVYVWNGTTDASNYVSATPDEGIITKPSGAVEITIEHFGVTSNYAIKAKEGANQGKYFKGDGGNGFTLENAQQNTSIGDVTDMGFTFSNSSSYLRFNTTAGQTRFRYYKQTTAVQNAYKEICLYEPAAAFSDYLTQCCTLEPVTNLAVSSTTSNSVTLSWTAPSPTTGIDHLELRNASTDVKIGSNISVGTTSKSVSGLEECETYSYKIVSVGATCETSSDVIEAQPFSGAKTVTFNYNGGSGTPTSFTTSCAGNTVTLPTPNARDGYTFLGWYPGEYSGSKTGDAGDTYTVSGTTTLWAHWSETNYTVTMAQDPAAGATLTGGTTTAHYGGTINISTTVPGGYRFTGWTASPSVTFADASATSTSFTMPASNVTVTANFVQVHTLTFITPSGGGSAVTPPATADNGGTVTLPNVTGIAAEYSCETFLGWTTTAPNAEGGTKWSSTPTIKAAGATSDVINSNTTFYAVYSRSGGGASGTVELTCTDISNWWTVTLSSTKNSYGTVTHHTALDGSVWYTDGQIQGAACIDLKAADNRYIQIPTLPGTISSIVMSVSQSTASNTAACGTGNETTHPVAFRTTASGSNVFTGTSSSHSCTINISSGDYYTGYIVNTDNTTNIHSVVVNYGPAPVISHNVACPDCEISQFTLSYNANTTYFPGSTTSCTGVTDYIWANHDDIYTICSTEPTLAGYKFTGWATSANGSGTVYEAGQEISCVPETPLTLYAQYERVYTITFNDMGSATNRTQGSAGAAVSVPSHTTPCVMAGATWEFAGWSKTGGSLVDAATATIDIAANATEYTPIAADDGQTFYAVYKKTLSGGGSFSVGKTGVYKFYATKSAVNRWSGTYNTTSNYIYGNTIESGFDILGYRFTYFPSGTYAGKYTIQYEDGDYIGYSGSSTSLVKNASAADNHYYWTITASGSGFIIQNVNTPTRYLSSDGGNFNGKTTSEVIYFVAADVISYYTVMACASTFSLTFDDGGGTINWAVGHAQGTYEDVADGTTFSTFPTATIDGWKFIGWTVGQGYSDMSKYSSGRDATTGSGIIFPEAADIYGGEDGTSGNSYTIHSNVTMYPIFTRFEDNEPFDVTNGGDYYIYYLADGTDDGYGDEKRVYAGTYDGEKRYSHSLTCVGATTFTFTKLGNGKWTIYDNTTHMYLCDKNDDWLCQQSSPAEWTISVYSGNEFDAYSTHDDYHIMAYDNATGASTATFQNYNKSNLVNNFTRYHRVFLGGCTNRVFSSNPSTTPIIDLKGTAVITSSQNGAVRATNVLTVSGHTLTPSTGIVTISSDNSDIYFSTSTAENFARAAANQPKSSVTVTANSSGIVTPTTIYVHYKPSSNLDAWTDVTVTASYTGAEDAEVTIPVRSVKENFVIAAKVAGSWYALPANMGTEGVFEPVLIEVDESNKVAYGPSTVGYKMWPVQTVNGGTDEYATNGDKVRFAGNSNAGLWASNSNNHIRDWATITAIGSTAETPAAYEWELETADRETYTMKSLYSTNYLDLYRPSSGGNAGKLVWASNSTYETNEVHFFPLTERAIISIIPREWKSNGLVFAIDADNNISLTSGHTTAKIGTGEAASATLTRHSTGGYGLYEVALPDLTSHYGKVLTLKMKIGGVDTYAYATIPIIVSGTTTTTTANTPFTALDAASKDYDVVILDGAKLTTNATASHACKFQNFYVYSGGTWINDNGSTSFNYLELRGGIKGIGAKDSHVQGVPHVLLNKAVSSTAGANLDMTVYTDHGYALSVPFDVDLSKVNFANSLKPGTGAQVNGTLASQFWIRKYDGAVRAANGKGGWVDITPADNKTIHAGEGYTLQGKRPKGQPFAVIRFPFSGVDSWANSSGEVAKANIPIYAHDGSATTPDNDKGWNLIANPYMATIAYDTDDELTWAASFKVGSLEKTDGDTWDGKYQWKNASNAYVTIPNDSYTAYPQTRASKATFYPFKNFFIQASSNGVVAFVRADRSEIQQRLMAQEEQMAPIFADINLAHGGESAQAGLTIDADATTGYKFGEDYTIFESREALDYLKVYTIADGHYLVGNTLTPEETAELIPLEFYAPNTEGAYVFSLDDDSDIDRLEYMILYDAELGLSTNLLTDNYTVNLGKTGLIENRFSIGLKIRENQNTPTGTDNVNGETERPFKFIYQDKMYILRGGVLYDATGKRVMEINK